MPAARISPPPYGGGSRNNSRMRPPDGAAPSSRTASSHPRNRATYRSAVNVARKSSRFVRITARSAPRSEAYRPTASTSASGVAASSRMPFRPGTMVSGIAPTRVLMTARPCDIASRIVRGWPSSRVGCTRTCARRKWTQRASPVTSPVRTINSPNPCSRIASSIRSRNATDAHSPISVHRTATPRRRASAAASTIVPTPLDSSSDPT